MDDKKLTKEELKNFFLNMKKEGLDVGIKLKMPSQKEPEIIMNYNSSIDVKLEYYLNTYDDYLVHKNNSEIQIIDMIGTSIPF
ncbi:MAG: hypothetical protein KIC90_04625 [Firmicutes bacterium]|nr:hypothetical protein [Bacillota bacterium]